jgi:hypothetical protein
MQLPSLPALIKATPPYGDPYEWHIVTRRAAHTRVTCVPAPPGIPRDHPAFAASAGAASTPGTRGGSTVEGTLRPGIAPRTPVQPVEVTKTREREQEGDSSAREAGHRAGAQDGAAKPVAEDASDAIVGARDVESPVESGADRAGAAEDGPSRNSAVAARRPAVGNGMEMYALACRSSTFAAVVWKIECMEHDSTSDSVQRRDLVLRSNLAGTSFCLERGSAAELAEPDDTLPEQSTSGGSNATICARYRINPLWLRGPQSLSVWRRGISDPNTDKQTDDTLMWESVPPRRSSVLSRPKLPWVGFAEPIPSTKNFQLREPGTDNIVLQFAKISDKCHMLGIRREAMHVDTGLALALSFMECSLARGG